MTDIDWARFRARDWLGAAATLFALAVTFNAEYEIAISVHINPIVAYAVPGALDVYVLRALQVKRDVFLTVLAMVLVNAASHLVTAGVLRVSPALIVGVSAIAPLVLWRAHVLRHEASTKPERWWRRSTVPPVPEHVPASDKHAPEPCPYCDTITENMFEHVDVCPRWSYAVPGFEEHAAQAVDVASTGTVNVPEHWCGHGHDHAEHRHTAYDTELVCLGVGADKYGEYKHAEHDDMEQITRAWHAKHTTGCTCPVCSDGWDGTVEYPSGYVGDIEARVLSLVPPLPAGFEHVLADGDKEFLDRARELSTPTIRALKELGMGNDRARRIKQYLETEHNGGTA